MESGEVQDYRRQFLEDIKVFVREIFNIVSWLVITVAISWAAQRLQSISLQLLYFLLAISLCLYSMSVFFAFLAWLGPEYAFDAPRSRRKLVALVITFLLFCALNPAVDHVVSDLVKLEDMKLPPTQTIAPSKDAATAKPLQKSPSTYP